MKRPHVTKRCVADSYAGPDERIVEFGALIPTASGGSRLAGGLISFRVTSDGALLVDIYRVDPNVLVRAPAATTIVHSDRPPSPE